MAKATFNIGEGFKEVFGKRIPLFGAILNPDAAKLPEFDSIEALAENYEDAPDRFSHTGVVVADRVRFSDGQNEYALPLESVVTYRRAKNIVKTPLQGKDGTVKEYISLDDWQITIQGMIIDYDQMAYPIDRVNELRQWFDKNQELDVVSDWMTTLGIHQVVVTDVEFPPLPGYANVQPFEIMLLSDEPVELLIQA